MYTWVLKPAATASPPSNTDGRTDGRMSSITKEDGNSPSSRSGVGRSHRRRATTERYTDKGLAKMIKGQSMD